MNSVSFNFIIGTIVFFIILYFYVFIRSNWISKEKHKYPNYKFTKSHDVRVWSFWIWDIRKLIIKSEGI